ncbi:hypothetical protein K2173_004566 [Erythroxylum novogranatense]|uniref:Uncharacterized protein n=1 Tax=Erythroxylum novogranatense TaxID=1862640 RepID=A0AAV8T4Q0_9ROSI|nr:hypothetical protein K2173_004566 [Erythroxylum novogranatense]
MLRAAHSDQIPLKRGTWTAEEDQKLISYITRNGIWNWNSLPRAAGLSRTGKSCRLRWVNYLRPDLKHGNFSNEEVETIIKLQLTMGNRWSKIAARLPGRTDNEIKNFWNAHLKKRLKKVQANDPFQGTIQSKFVKSSEDGIGNLFPCAQKESIPAEGLGGRPTSSEPSVGDFSSSSGSLIELESIGKLEEDSIDFLDFSGDAQSSCQRSLSVGPTHSFCDGSVVLGNQLRFQHCIKPCTSYSTGFPISPNLSTLNFSSTADSVAEINQNHVIKVKNSYDSQGLSSELQNFLEKPFSVDDLLKVEDDAPTSTNLIWLDGSCSYPFTFPQFY